MRSLREVVAAGEDPGAVIGAGHLEDIVVRAVGTELDDRAERARDERSTLEFLRSDPYPTPTPELTLVSCAWSAELLEDPFLVDAVLALAVDRIEVAQRIDEQRAWLRLTADVLDGAAVCDGCGVELAVGTRAATVQTLVLCVVCITEVARDLGDGA